MYTCTCTCTCTCRYIYTLHNYMYIYVLLHIYKRRQRFEGSFPVLSQPTYSVHSAWTCLCVHTTYYIYLPNQSLLSGHVLRNLLHHQSVIEELPQTHLRYKINVNPFLMDIHIHVTCTCTCKLPNKITYMYMYKGFIFPDTCSLHVHVYMKIHVQLHTLYM